jgi:ABC-2 type transport system ATP-binding protein
VYGFVGANGAGKTTAMRIMLGVLAADSGVVRWQGKPVTFETRRRFGYMPEERGLYPKMRVTEHLVYLARLHGLDLGTATRSADALTERLGVAERRTDAIEKLSLGNQQRVQLAAALVHDPEVLVLDEPFSGLDPVGVDALAGVLLERARRGVPVVFSSHQLDLVERLCDSVGIINAGRMVATGTVEDLRAQEGRRQLLVIVRDAPAGWAAVIPGVTVVSERRGELVLELADGVDDQEVLAAAARAGRVEHFSWRQPTLTELFREAVIDADEQAAPAEGGRDRQGVRV